jgi:hypothetical protein
MILKEIQKILEKEEFTCSLFSASKEIPFDRLMVFLGLDAQKRERMLEIMADQQQVAPEYQLPQAAILPSRIQFRVQLPFKVQDIALNQVASLLLFLNQFIDLPGFELDELNGLVVYRYVWIIQSDAINAPLIMSIMGAVMLNLSLFSEMIESLATGKMSFNDLLSQVIQLAEGARPKKSS